MDESRIPNTAITHIVKITLAHRVERGISSVAHIVECGAVNHASPGNKTGKSRGTQKVKVQFYSLVSSLALHPAVATLPTLHNYPLVTGPVHTLSHLNSPGSIQPCCHFWRMELLSHIATTVLPGTHSLLGRESAFVGEVPCPRAQTPG